MRRTGGRSSQRSEGVCLRLRPLSRAESRFRLGPHANVLWRLDRGEIDGLHPCIVVIHIGTNNTSQTGHARQNTAEEIVAGIAAICGRVRSKTPAPGSSSCRSCHARKSPTIPAAQIAEINRLLVKFAQANHLDLLDLCHEDAQARRHAAEVVDAGLLSSERRRLHDLGRRPETILRSGQERTERHALNETA